MGTWKRGRKHNMTWTQIARLIAIYTPEISTLSTRMSSRSMLYANVGLVHDNQPEHTLMGARDKDIERVLMINQELQ